MPIKSLESFLFETRLVSATSIELLQNATIGIDVEHYLSRIYTFKKEQYLAGVGGTPSSLKDYVQLDLQVFKEFNIKPIFVIPGLGIESQHAEYKTNEFSYQEQHRLTTWNNLHSRSANPYLYNNSNTELFRLFTDPLPLRPMINDLLRYFLENNIDYLISPYDALFQLSYLYNNGFVDSIYGSTDVLLCNVDKFILGMEFLTKDFRFIDRAKVLYELGLTERQFVDLSIMVGCNLQPKTFLTFPPLPKPNPLQLYPQLNYFKLGLEIVYQLNLYSPGTPGDLHAYIVSLNDPELLSLYYKGHAAMKYLPILSKDGHVELYLKEMDKLGFKDGVKLFSDLEKIQVPNDVHEIISQKLPPELYFYQLLGLLPLRLLEAITQGKLSIRPSSDGGLPDSYKKLITSSYYKDTFDLQINLITQLLARYYQVKKIKVDYWFRDGFTELNNRLIPSAHDQVAKFKVVLTDFSSDSNTFGNTFSLVNLFERLDNEFLANITSSSGPREIKSTSDILATSLIRALFLVRGFIDQKKPVLTPLGTAVNRFITESLGLGNVTESELLELILLLLLMNCKVIKLNEPIKDYHSIPRTFKDPSSAGEKLSDLEVQHITLISRIFSLHRLNISAINYQGPISRLLMSFRSHVKVILNNVSSMVQACLVDLCARNEVLIRQEINSRQEWYNLVENLPFFADANNTLLGVVAEIYFEYSLRQKLSSKEKSKENIISSTKDHLLNLIFQVNNPSFNINVKGSNSVAADLLFRDLENGLSFWGKFLRLMGIVHEEDPSIVLAADLEAYKSTDEWMKQFV